MTNVHSNNTPQTTQTPTLNAAFFAAQKHPFHILGPSALPVLTGFFLFCWLVPLTFYMHGLPLPIFDTFRSDLIHMSFIGLFVTIMQWFLSVLKGVEPRFSYS